MWSTLREKVNVYHFLISRLYFFLQITDQNLITNYISNKKLISQIKKISHSILWKKEKERKKNWSPKPRKEEKCQLTTDWRLLHTKSVQLTTYIQLVGTLPTFNTLNFNKGPDNYCKSNEEFPKTASIYDGWWTKYLININT